MSHGAVEIVAELVRAEREARQRVEDRRLELTRAQEEHAVARGKLEAVKNLAGFQRMPTPRPPRKGKARK